MSSGRHPSVPNSLSEWLAQQLDDPGPFGIERLAGGNSNETLELRSPLARRVLRRPPAEALASGAHNVEREFRLIRALEGSDVPAPQVFALCTDPTVLGVPFLVMERIDGVALTDSLPAAYPPPAEAAKAVGEAVIDAVAALHAVPWAELGLADFGKPDGFLARQVRRWQTQLESYRTRDIPYHAEVATWLEANRPAEIPPAIMHGDFHLDNALMSPTEPGEVKAIIDWEMATIGDPLLDLGLLLGFWGERAEQPAMPYVSAISRVPGAPSRYELADRYAVRTGTSVERLDWYMALALWKLASIIESAYAQNRAGQLESEYARALEEDVPALVREAAMHAGLA
jgi:aminoglycoside phosphotransferase (APT) family kinase protein